MPVEGGQSTYLGAEGVNFELKSVQRKTNLKLSTKAGYFDVSLKEMVQTERGIVDPTKKQRQVGRKKKQQPTQLSRKKSQKKLHRENRVRRLRGQGE